MPDSEIAVLLIEDSPSDAKIFELRLAADGVYDFAVTHVSRLTEATHALRSHDFDVAVVDLGLPDAQGLDAVHHVQRAMPTLPVVVLSGLDDTHLATAAVNSGAQDYVGKDHLDTANIVRSIIFAIERRRIQDEQLRARDAVVARVSHELRTPLTVARCAFDLLADGRGGELNEQGMDLVRRGLRHTSDLTRMVEDLLDTAALDHGTLEIGRTEVSLSDVFETARARTATLSENSQIDITFDAGSASVVDADPDRVVQIVSNLISNAMRYTPEGGTVSVVAEDSGDDAVEVAVSDTGCGVDAHDAPRVFQKHYQGDTSPVRGTYTGTGLGLYICRALVEAHGGTIWVDTESAAGTTVRFTLPIAQAARSRARSTAVSGPPSG